MSACKWLDLEILRPWPVMLKFSPNTVPYMRDFPPIMLQRISINEAFRSVLEIFIWAPKIDNMHDLDSPIALQSLRVPYLQEVV